MRNQAGMNEKERTRRLAVMGLLCAVAYVIVAVCRIPIVSFLKYEPKDVVIVIGGFLLLLIGLVYFAVYYFLFRFLILKFNFKTPGREEDDVDSFSAAQEEAAETTGKNAEAERKV